MEDQAKQALSELLYRAVSGIDSTVAFSQVQMPDLVKQILVWHSVKSGISCVLAVVFCFCAYFMATRCWAVTKTEMNKHILEQETGVLVGMPVIGGLGTLVMMGGFFVNLNLVWLQILLAPKLYLLEYAAELVK